MKKIYILMTAAVFISANTIAQSNGTISLSKGQKYSVQNQVTTTSNSDMQGQTMETNASATTTFNIEVTSTDGNYNMSNKISAIKLAISGGGQNINFDSDKKEDMDGEIGSSVKDFINKTQPVVMDKTGNIILDKKTDSSKDSSSQTALLLKQLGDPELQGYGAKIAFLAVPKKLKAGQTWQDSTSNEGVTKVTSYTVKEINGDIATIEIAGTENRDTKMQAQQMEIETKASGKFTGEKMVNITNGIVQKDTVTLNASGTISVMGQDIPTTFKVTSANIITAM